MTDTPRPEALAADTWFRDDCRCRVLDQSGDSCALTADYTNGLCSHCQGHVADAPVPGLREALLSDLTALAHLTPEDWSERRGADPIARTINAARDIVDARLGGSGG